MLLKLAKVSLPPPEILMPTDEALRCFAAGYCPSGNKKLTKQDCPRALGDSISPSADAVDVILPTVATIMIIHR